MADRHANTGCGDDCRYRKLYEGSQQSLTDMAAKQAAALSKAGRFRNEIVEVLKRNFPRKFASTERRMGRRMSDCNDAALLAYLDRFVSQVKFDPHLLDDLVDVLNQRGYQLEFTDDLASIIDQLHEDTPPAAGSSSDADGQVGSSDQADAGGTPGRTTVHTGDNGSSLPDRQQADPPVSGPQPSDDLPVDNSQAPADADATLAELFADDSRPADENSTLGSVLDDLFGEPEPPTATSNADSQQPPAAPPQGQPDQQTDSSPTQDNSAGQTTHQNAGQAGGQPQHTDAEDNNVDDGPQTAGGFSTPDQLTLDADDTPDTPDASDDNADADAAEQQPAHTGQQATGQKATPPGGSPTSDNREEGGRPKQKLRGTPMRPDPGARNSKAKSDRKKKGGRKTRTKAQPPDPSNFDVPPEGVAAAATGDTDVDDDTEKALLAAVAIPRPVFAADLVSVAGSEQAVNSWLKSMRGYGNPVRIVGAKARHRARGDLVLPAGKLRDNAKEFTKSAWGDCVDTYRGSRLYELGVLLHQIDDGLITHDLGDDIVVFRANDPRIQQIVGIIAVLGTDLEPGGDTRQTVVQTIDSMIDERLRMLAVLPTRGDIDDEIDDLVRDAAQQHGWSPQFPVVTARSWDWADAAGTNSRAIIGI